MSERYDFAAIAQWIAPGSRVLDLGCGDGSLLKYLGETRGITGYGVEIDPVKVITCVKNGVNVLQRDLEAGLEDFESGSFDYVILSQTLQAMKQTEEVVAEILRVGREAIVTLPNFGYWLNRWQLLWGRMPVSRHLPYQWYDTPNVHFCTIEDFEAFCRARNIAVTERIVLQNGERVTLLPNLLGTLSIYRIQQNRSAMTG